MLLDVPEVGRRRLKRMAAKYLRCDFESNTITLVSISVGVEPAELGRPSEACSQIGVSSRNDPPNCNDVTRERVLTQPRGFNLLSRFVPGRPFGHSVWFGVSFFGPWCG